MYALLNINICSTLAQSALFFHPVTVRFLLRSTSFIYFCATFPAIFYFLFLPLLSHCIINCSMCTSHLFIFVCFVRNFLMIFNLLVSFLSNWIQPSICAIYACFFMQKFNFFLKKHENASNHSCCLFAFSFDSVRFERE